MSRVVSQRVSIDTAASISADYVAAVIKYDAAVVRGWIIERERAAQRYDTRACEGGGIISA